MRGRRTRFARAAALATLGSLVLAGAPDARGGPPGNLGNGLGRLLAPPAAKRRVQLDQNVLAVHDKAGRLLVDVYAADGTALATVRQRSEAEGMKVRDQSAEHKILEGYVAVSNVKALAATPGVASVSQALKPFTRVGAATSQGVHAQRVDRVPPGIDGSGITVGALSDSFDTATETIDGAPLKVHAADDVESGDLPAQGVTVLQDDPSAGATDEGRAMLQIVHDVAPRAKECFATADGGELNFADNIRALADENGPCGADVVVDDVGYFAEPFYGDGVISDAVDEVAAKGVHYFSSAGNGSGQQAYEAPLRLIGTDRPGDRSNIKLDGVDPNLYRGGFEDFDPGPGVDVAMDQALGFAGKDAGTGILDLQWDDPNDPNGAVVAQQPKVHVGGEITAAAPMASIPYDGAAGETIRGLVDAIPSGSTDFILTLKDPDGRILQQVDTGTSPETVFQTLPVTGRYTFEVSGFNGDLGDFTFDINEVLAKSKTTTDLNALYFDAAGNFLFSISDLNQFSGKPFEIAAFRGAGAMQIVIAEGGTDPGTATQLRFQLEGDLQYTEYVQPFAPSVFGHPTAKGAGAVAAYDPFRPTMPEDFTSVGGDLPILFDSGGNRFAQPQIRRKPDVAATDGGNTTFFVSDAAEDDDTLPNFFGTSAAAPHAAAIAALVLQAGGGPGSVSPSRMRSILQGAAFPHDLDTSHSEAANGGLTITADGPQGDERRTNPTLETVGSMNDPQFFRVAYSGPGSIVSLTFDGAGADPTGLGTRPGEPSAGLVFDPRPFRAIPALGGPDLFDQGFPFTVAAASQGIDTSAITAQFDRNGVGRATNRQFQVMTVRFPDGALGDGRFVAFGVDRDSAVTANKDAEGGNSADQLGQGLLFPDATVVGPGMSYRAVTSTGRVLTGTLRNRVGAGWTAVDGFGYINAQAAVGSPLNEMVDTARLGAVVDECTAGSSQLVVEGDGGRAGCRPRQRSRPGESPRNTANASRTSRSRRHRRAPSA
jgi:Subtilase family